MLNLNTTRPGPKHADCGNPSRPQSRGPEQSGVDRSLRAQIEVLVPRLRRYARAMARDPVAADDLVQDCLVRALGKIHLWKEGTDLRAWLFSCITDISATRAGPCDSVTSSNCRNGNRVRRPRPIRSSGWNFATWSAPLPDCRRSNAR